MNHVFLIGNVTKDPETYTTQGGVTKASFTLAVQHRFANQQGVREADFIPIVTWRQTADFVKTHVTKGKKLSVMGTLQIRSYEKDGRNYKVAEVVSDEVEILSPKGSNDNTAEAPAENMQVEDDPELPF